MVVKRRMRDWIEFGEFKFRVYKDTIVEFKSEIDSVLVFAGLMDYEVEYSKMMDDRVLTLRLNRDWNIYELSFIVDSKGVLIRTDLDTYAGGISKKHFSSNTYGKDLDRSLLRPIRRLKKMI